MNPIHSSPTQAAEILAYLESGKRLTPLDALQRFGCFRLGARIWELKKAGHPIETEMVQIVGGKHVASYSLKANSLVSTHCTP